MTRGGIQLPPGIVELSTEEARLHRVAIKMAQGLIYRDRGIYLSSANCVDMRFCSSPGEMEEFYDVAWKLSDHRAVVPEVFGYRSTEFENLRLLMMLLWESQMACCAFEDPGLQIDKE